MLQKYLPGNFAVRSCVRSGAGYAAGCGMSAPVFSACRTPLRAGIVLAIHAGARYNH